ncbi:phosphate ABC transporter permease subunit PstC [Leptolinea tardivitalis]|uniref:phosphate ABC transporter permease subunit PstC n=1 Tax=Leptolinea tardivitalis TaxID=229920 RepID=UPI00078322C6|nr:phosphate ABC transporter permease subunit PstC [Leptolinea tardivitalis]GAP22087.1 phosphate ABC transporter membrane protein 1, PhoT family [Leptolinea tardivitalis]
MEELHSVPAWKETLVTRIIQICGYSSILFVILILYFLLSEGLPALWKADLNSLFSTRWYPTESYFGIWPLIFGSLFVTLGAGLVSVPLGIGTAVYISEVAPSWTKEILKPLVELLAGLPSVVLGFLGIQVLVPFMRRFFDLPTGLTALSGAILLGMISIPTMVSVAEDALNTVPKSYREASMALGATRWQTIWGVTLPAAKSGVITAVLLGMGRAMGETMAVMMVTGNAPVMPQGLQTIILPIRTMTATIASEMGEVAAGSVHYSVLFLIGIILFIISLVVNVVAFTLTSRKTTRSERLLS